jgi:hypothetical protein
MCAPGCGTINANLKLSDRVYDCGDCGLIIDRDRNAAVDLARYTATPPKPCCYQWPSDARTAPAPGGPGQEPTATSLHEGALGRNQHKTTASSGGG